MLSPAELIGKAEAVIAERVCSKMSVCVGSCPQCDVDGLLQGRRAYGRRDVYGEGKGDIYRWKRKKKEIVGEYLYGYSFVYRCLGWERLLVEQERLPGRVKRCVWTVIDGGGRICVLLVCSWNVLVLVHWFIWLKRFYLG